MRWTREKFFEVFKRFDLAAAELWGRPLSEEEKAVAHSTIYEVARESQARGLPFSVGLEARWYRLPAQEVLFPLYDLIRKQRKAIETWCCQATRGAPTATRALGKSFSSQAPCLPFLGLKLAILNF